MRKGNYGFNLWFYPAIAFALAIFGQILLCGVVTILAIAAEKDEWTSRQTVSAFLLALVNSVINAVVTVAGVLTWFPLLGGMLDSLLSICSGVVAILVILVAISSILKVSRGEDAKLPVISGIVDKIFA